MALVEVRIVSGAALGAKGWVSAADLELNIESWSTIEIPQPVKSNRVRVDPVEQSKKLRTKVDPTLSPLLKRTDIRGVVTLDVVVGFDGSVTQTRIKAGSPILIQPVIEAVSRWKYEPTIVEGKAVEVDTTVTVEVGSNP